MDPTDPDIVYAAGYPGFHKTTDGGDTWQTVSGGISGNTYAVVVDYSEPNIVYTGGTNGLFKSTNSGNTWANVGLSGVNAILIDPDDHSTVYAGTATGVYMSTDGGDTWEAMSDGLEDLYVTSLGVFPDNYLFCGTDVSGMYRWEISTGLDELVHSNSLQALKVVPNPARRDVTIIYQMPTENQVMVSIFDAQGRFVRDVVRARLPAGSHTQHWDGVDALGTPVAAGVYFCRLTVGAKTDIVKIVLTR